MTIRGFLRYLDCIFHGVWANGSTIEYCRHELIGVLEEWILLKTRDHEDIPIIEGIDINVNRYQHKR